MYSILFPFLPPTSEIKTERSGLYITLKIIYPVHLSMKFCVSGGILSHTQSTTMSSRRKEKKWTRRKQMDIRGKS